MNLDLPELARIEGKLDAIICGTSKVIIPEWCSLKKAWELKQGCAYKTMRSRRYLQPKGGFYDAYVGGVGVYSRKTIEEWLLVDDSQLQAYHDRNQTGCVIDSTATHLPRGRRPRSLSATVVSA